MHVVTFIQDLAVIMLVAGIIAVLCHRFNQPVVLGYILAGIILGPYTPPFEFIHDEKIIKILAELGVIFLMFALGLEFDLHKLRKVGLAAFVAAFSEIVIMISAGYGIGRMFGWSSINSLFLGAILSISSTTIIVKALEDLKMKQEKFAKLIFGILIIEDIFAIAILALLSTAAATGSITFNDVFIALLKLIIFLVISLLLGILFVPMILAYVNKFHNKEMLLITSLGLCFGFCLLVLKLNYSVALGAFLIGAIIAESQQLRQIEKLVIPLRDMFSAIFFVSVGLLFDPRIITQYTLPILVITIVVIIGKILSGSLGMLITGQDGKTSMRVGMGLAQIGEFSFIIAALGISLNVTGNFLYLIAVAVSVITTLLTPHLIRFSDVFTNQIAKFIPEKLLILFQRYRKWLNHLKPEQGQVGLIYLAQRSCILVLINLFIVLAIFWLGDAIPDTNLGLELKYMLGENFQRIALWSIALIISLPFLISIYRKIQALSLLLTEHYIGHLRRTNYIVSIFVAVSVLIGISLIILRMSNNILPPTKFFIPALIIPVLLIVFLLPWFVNIHSKLQLRLSRILKKNNNK